jgi:hypothetical protein
MGRQLARMALAGLPRGGGDGDAIRMGILHIMRENGIREGHRPVTNPSASLSLPAHASLPLGLSCAPAPHSASLSAHAAHFLPVPAHTPLLLYLFLHVLCLLCEFCNTNTE